MTVAIICGIAALGLSFLRLHGLALISVCCGAVTLIGKYLP